MGIPDLRDLSLCLLASWVQRYQDGEGKIWKSIVDFKYNGCEPNVLYSSARNSSPFWKWVKWAAQAAKLGYCWKVGNDKKITFWGNQ
jgi:hypothetical protein